MRQLYFHLPAFFAFSVLSAQASYDEQTGFTRLKAELGAALPNGTGVGVTQVEATPATGAYMAQGGSGTFPGTGYWSGKTFSARSGTGTYSAHAFEVGLHFYGSNTSAASFRASMAPGVVDVDCSNANSWDDDFLAPSGAAPVPETRAVQNHSWIYEAPSGQGGVINDLLRRQDFSVNRDNYVCCAGLNNGPLSAIPDLFAAAYNVISVGLTNGEHSRGTTTADMDGSGRRKPEIVAPLDATSFSTAYVSSAAALLRQKANQIGTLNARNSRVLRAVLLAGATKDEFPNWARTAVHPIDSVFGAGELNIYHSYTILNGGEQPENSSSGRPFAAWDLGALSSGTTVATQGTADYRLNIPAGSYGTELSAFVVWNRTLTDSSSPGFSLSPDTLINFNLTLYRDPSAGGAEVTIDASSSTLYNLEHVYVCNLPAGNYRLRVRRASAGSSGTYAIAWRLHTQPHAPQPVMVKNGAVHEFTFPGLVPGQPYLFQSSGDIAAWSTLYSFTATGDTHQYSQPVTAAPRLFYRLLPVLP